MYTPVRPKFREIATAAIVAIVLIVFATDTQAEPAQRPGPLEQDNATIGQQATTLPAIVRAILAEALVKEQEFKQRGPRRSGTPYANSALCPFEHRPCDQGSVDHTSRIMPR